MMINQAHIDLLIAKKPNLCDFIIDKIKQFAYIPVPLISPFISPHFSAEFSC